MARLMDVWTIRNSIGLGTLAKRVWGEILADHIFLFAAALAYAWLLAAFPFFIFMLNLIPYLPDQSQALAVESIQVFLQAMLPSEPAHMIWVSMSRQIESAIVNPAGASLSISLIVALWIASGGTTVTMAALDKCYELEQIRAYYKRRPMALALTLLISGMLFAMLLLVPLGQAFKRWVFEHVLVIDSFWPLWLFDVFRAAVRLAVVFLIVGMIYHYGCCVKRRWRAVTPGAAFCLIVWVVLALAFKYYFDHFDNGRYSARYGAAGWVVILMLFFYVGAVVLLAGAEINSEIDFEILKVPRGSRNFRGAERAMRRRGPQPPVAAPSGL